MSQTPEDPFQQRPEDAPAPAAGETPPGQAQPPQQPQQPYAQPPAGQQYTQQPGQPPQYAQPPAQQYPQPYPSQQPYAQPMGPRPGTEKNWMGTTALVLGIVGLFTGITAIGGIVFGHLGRAAARRGEADNGGMALAGLIISYVLVVLSIVAVIAMFALFGWFYNECGGDNPASWCDPEVVSTWDASAT